MQLLSAMIFCLLAATALIYGWWHNRGYDRALVVTIGLSIILTAALGLTLPPQDAYIGVLTVDFALALVAIGVALYSSTHWPMWFAAFALAGALTAITNSWMGSEYWLFRMLTGFWAVPALLSLLIGSVQDARSRGRGAARAGAKSPA